MDERALFLGERSDDPRVGANYPGSKGVTPCTNVIVRPARSITFVTLRVARCASGILRRGGRDVALNNDARRHDERRCPPASCGTSEGQTRSTAGLFV